MACEDDPYVYVLEDGYSSDEEDISDSLVSGIVEEAFRTERLSGNTNPSSQRSLCPSDSDTETLAVENRCFSSDECFPMIKITEITGDTCLDELDTGTSQASNSLNQTDVADNKAHRTVSDGFLPEKTVRFTQNTPHASTGEKKKKKYPTTPKKTVQNLGPSLSLLKTQLYDSSSAPEEEISRLTCPTYFPDSPCDMSPHNPSPCSPASCTGYLKEVDTHILSLEEDLIKLKCALTNMESNASNTLLEPAVLGSGTVEDRLEASQEQTSLLKDLEQSVQESLKFLEAVNSKWTVHKRHLDDFLSETQQLEGGYFMLGNRVKEQNTIILKLKEERRALEEFLQDKEYEWFLVKKSLRTDSNFIKGLIKEAQHTRDKDTLWKVLDSFLLIYFDREKAIALDTAKQNKINELRLLICRQQLHIAEVEELNRELECEIRHQAGHPLSSADSNTSCLKDVLYCDHTWYSPLCSTNPEYVSLQMLNIGGPHPELVYERKPVFNSARLFPQKDGDGSASDLAEYDHYLLKELKEHGPGSEDFRLE